MIFYTENFQFSQGGLGDFHQQARAKI